MINRVVLVGRLTKDPVLRKTHNGVSCTSFTLAVNRNYKQDGQPDADFINMVAWNKTADVVAQYTHKGSLIGVEGRIQTRNYDDQTGRHVYVTEVIADSMQFLESKNASTNNAYVPENQGSNEKDYTNSYDSDDLEISADDLPF